MKRELFAAALLSAILALSMINSSKLAHMTEDISQLTTQAVEYAGQEQWQRAELCSRRAMAIWEQNKDYTHVVLRHDSIDSTSEKFYELLEHIYDKDQGGTYTAASLLNEQLNMICQMERIRLGSIF